MDKKKLKSKFCRTLGVFFSLLWIDFSNLSLKGLSFDLEISCRVMFSCSRKEIMTLNRLKALLAKKFQCKLMLDMNENN